jgi:glycosyltransferase involved in cell wall biosynthesis
MISISVAMGTYNGARHLRAQLDSLAAQSLLPFELHVGDDRSADETVAIVEAFGAEAPFPVHLHVNERNLGFGENFMRTALRCSGDWVAFCDQDDVWLPNKLRTCAEEIAAGPADLGLVAHNATVTDGALNPQRTMFDYPKRKLWPRLALEPDWHCVGFTQVVRRRLLADVPTRPRPTVPWNPWPEPHDVWTAVLANATGSILFLGEPLALYRRHGATVTSSSAGPGGAGRLKALLANNGASYLARADYLRTIAADLRINSGAAPADLASKMTDAADRIARFAETIASRGALHEAARIAPAFAAYRRLLSHGAYRGGGDWPLGAKALLKDAAAVLAAPFWRNR